MVHLHTNRRWIGAALFVLAGCVCSPAGVIGQETPLPPTLPDPPSQNRPLVGLSFQEVNPESRRELPPVATLPPPRELGGGLTLDQVINTCLLADPKLRAGFEAINQARGDAMTAALKPNPNFNVNQTLLPLTRPFTPNNQGGPPQLDAGFSYQIDWFLFGKRVAAMRSAALGVQVSEADYADLIRQRVLEAATGYFDVLEAKAIRELARQDVDNLVRIEAVTSNAVEKGGRPPVELNRVRLDRLKAEQALRDAQNNVVAAEARLQSILGESDPDPNFSVAGNLEKQQFAQPLPVEEAFAIAKSNRPDVNSLQLKIQQAQADTLVEKRKAYPTVTPVAGVTRQFQQSTIGFPDASSFGFGLTMSLPIYDRNQGNRFKAASIVEQNNHELLARIVALRAEVIQVLSELTTAAANSKAVAEEQLKLAEQVRNSINQAYEAGGRPLLDVLDAQRNYRETYRAFITSRANYGRASMRFYATLGERVVR